HRAGRGRRALPGVRRPGRRAVPAAARPARRRHPASGRPVEDGRLHQRRDRRAARLLAAHGGAQAGDDSHHLEQGAGAMRDTPGLPTLSPAEARRIDQACDRFEAAWKAGQRPHPGAYLGTGGEPERSALLRQLLLLDWDYRRRAGDDPQAGDYHARFPGDSAVIEGVCRAMTESGDSTCERPVRRHSLDTPWSGGEEVGRTDNPPHAEEAGRIDNPSHPDRYELLQEVGQGGIGVVFRGRDRLLGRELAVKVLREAYQDNPEARRRFTEEARVGSQLQHPAIVPVYEPGSFGDRRPYLTMKLVEGHTLAALLQKRA